MFRKRYFVLKGSKLFFSKGEHVDPHGMIDLSACLTVKSAEIKIGRKCAIEVATSDGKVFYMCADSDKEKDDWIGALGRGIVQSGSTYQNDEPFNSDDDDDDEE